MLKTLKSIRKLLQDRINYEKSAMLCEIDNEWECEYHRGRKDAYEYLLKMIGE